MSATHPTFEEVDRHIQNADLAAVQQTSLKAAGLSDVCPIYKIVRPFLLMIANVPLIPQKWKDAIKIFIQVLDAICP